MDEPPWKAQTHKNWHFFLNFFYGWGCGLFVSLYKSLIFNTHSQNPPYKALISQWTISYTTSIAFASPAEAWIDSWGNCLASLAANPFVFAETTEVVFNGSAKSGLFFLQKLVICAAAAHIKKKCKNFSPLSAIHVICHYQPQTLDSEAIQPLSSCFSFRHILPSAN